MRLNNIEKIIRETMSKMSSPSSSEIEEKRVTSIIHEVVEVDCSTEQEGTKVHTNPNPQQFFLLVKHLYCS